MDNYGYNFENYQAAGFGNTATSMAWDAVKYATIRNPFFTRRLGTSGWDPATSKVMSKLNWLVSPEASTKWRRVQELRNPVASTAKKAGQLLRANKNLTPLQATMEAGDWLEKRAARMGKLGSLATGKGSRGGIFSRAWQRITKSFVGVTGETAFNPLEKQVYKSSIKKHAGRWIAQLVGKETPMASRWAAGMYGLGRVATAANIGLLAWEGGKLAFGAVAGLANMGAQARLQPTRGYGTGIQTSPAAATMRQRAVMEMMGSEFGPRNVIGNEAPFLHV